MGNFKNELKSYKSIPRALVFDNTLSDRARFIYVFMACKPDGWDFFLEPMSKDIGYSIDTLRKYINELIKSGWLEKGEQQKNNGLFGSVEYTLKATKISDTEKFRHGEKPTLDNIDNIDKRDNYKEKNDKDKSLSKKDELFEKCWVAYNRKGSKKKSLEQWLKMKDEEKQVVLPHIQAYCSTRELRYQKDFERYLRDKIYTTIVFDGNIVVYDPNSNDNSEYHPITGGSLTWNDYYKCYLYTGWYVDGDRIYDGYDDTNRPDGASIMLNNGRGTIAWDGSKKSWVKK